ncbi:alpha/beta fold hydrolase [Rubrivirga sp. IMCC45206]|uniref:alpha/beta fold hydrolase n=1 Tax=Rubrivirga sp. IMCC45206 TaxID=3391614 RepID=UPI00398FBF30
MRPPLVLLHGFMGRGADWDAVREHLPEKGDVLAPDLPGHGTRADASPDDTTMDAEADRLVAALDGPADWVGYSLGGRLALHLAVRHPEAVRRLVLVSASPGLRTSAERASRRETDASRAARLLRDFPAFVDAWYRMPLFALPDGPRRRLTADRIAHNDPAGLARSLGGMGTGAQPSHWDALDGISAPTLAVAGARDAKFVALAAAMATAPAIRAATVPDAAHLLPAERPAALASLLRTHLD